MPGLPGYCEGAGKGSPAMAKAGQKLDPAAPVDQEMTMTRIKHV